MQKTVAIIIVVAVILFSFSEREIYKKDIQNRLVIQGVGIDKEDDGTYTVVIQAYNTTAQSSAGGESGSENPVKVYKTTGNTVYSAIRSVTEIEGKLPLHSQNRVVVICKKIAEEGMEEVLDYFVRDVENSASVYVSVADGKASEILATTSETGDVVVRNIARSIKAAIYEPEIASKQIYQLVNRNDGALSCFYLPMLSVKEDEKTKEKTVEIEKTALFANSKMVGSVSKEDTVMLNFLCNKIYNGVISFKIDENEKAALGIIKSKTKRTVKLDGNTPVFTIKINAVCDIAELCNGINETLGQEKTKAIKEMAEAYIKNEMERVIDQIYRERNCDASGLSRLIISCYPSFYRENEKNLSTVMAESQYNVEVDITLRRVGQEFADLS